MTDATSGSEIRIDRDRCIGSGNCAFQVPDVFDVDETGRAVIIGSVGDDERVLDAVEQCPTEALTLVREDD